MIQKKRAHYSIVILNLIMTQEIKKKIEDYGLLLEADPDFPSIVGLVTGEKIKGSWWGHRKGHKIFSISRKIRDEADILVIKLISGKVTYVHKRLWTDLISIFIAKQNWQIGKMSKNGKRILELVEKAGVIRADNMETQTTNKFNKIDLNKAINEIEKGLLIFCNEVHTEKRYHVKLLKTWNHFLKEKSITISGQKDIVAAKENIDKIVAELNTKFDSTARLPWWTKNKFDNTE